MHVVLPPGTDFSSLCPWNSWNARRRVQVRNSGQRGRASTKLQPRVALNSSNKAAHSQYRPVDSIRAPHSPNRERVESTWPAAAGLSLFGRIQSTAGSFKPADVIAILLAYLITSPVLSIDARGDMSGSIPAAAHSPPYQLQAVIEGDLVTLEARSVPVEAVLSELARQSNLEIRAYGPIAEPISIELERVPLPEALHRILRNCDYALQYNSNDATEGSPTDKPHRTLWIYSTNREIDGQVKSSDDPQSSPIDVDSLNNVQNLENIARL